MSSKSFAVLAVLLGVFAASASVQGASLQRFRDLQGDGSASLRGVSDDGSVIVGEFGGEAFRWTSAGGMIGIGTLGGTPAFSEATSVSGDGSVVVGRSSSASGTEAFRWTSDSGMIGLGDLPGGVFNSGAADVSSDGLVVVGGSASASGAGEAFRWTSDSGMVGLGDLPGGYFESSAFGVSYDGSVVVGRSVSASGWYEAFRWTSGGMERLWDVLVAEGINPAADGWTALWTASAVSADGSTIVGRGLYNGFDEAFLAFTLVVPEPSSVALLTLSAPALMLRRRRRTVCTPTTMSFYRTADRIKGAIR